LFLSLYSWIFAPPSDSDTRPLVKALVVYVVEGWNMTNFGGGLLVWIPDVNQGPFCGKVPPATHAGETSPVNSNMSLFPEGRGRMRLPVFKV
jgi:hypothetical protein